MRIALLCFALCADGWLVQAGQVSQSTAAGSGLSGTMCAPGNSPIAWAELGATATAQYSGDGLSVAVMPSGVVRLRCAFQRLAGEVTREGLWLESTVPGGAMASGAATVSARRFRLVADAVGREGGTVAALPRSGTASGDASRARFARPGLVEEYSVSVDGVRQDFVVAQPPAGAGDLRVELAVDGAKVEALAGPGEPGAGSGDPAYTGRAGSAVGRVPSRGAQLVLDSGRKLAYSRLQVVDATGRALAARMAVIPVGDEVTSLKLRGESSKRAGDQSLLTSSPTSGTRLAVWVVDANAVYPVRIDPTFSDANWSALGTGMSSSVNALAVSDTYLYAGGQFSKAGGTDANGIAKWDGTSWSALGTGVGMSGSVNALAVSGTNLYAGGLFTTADGTSANYIAKWNGAAWSALGAGMNSSVNALAVSGTNLYAGGYFISAGGSHVARWDGASWSALGAGVNNTVYALAVSGTNLYAGGEFSTDGGAVANRVAKWDGTSWSALGSGMNSTVNALAVSGTNLYAGGLFTTANGTSANYIAKWNGAAWSALGSGMDGSVNALAVLGTSLYAGGFFTYATNGTSTAISANYIAKWDGAAWSALASGMNSYVYALAASDTNLYAGGNFTTAGGKASAYVACAHLPNTPPVPGPHYLGAVVNTPLTISASALAALDYDADGDPLSIIAVSGTSTNGPAGNVTLSGGNVHYTPASNFVGVDQFTYTISDGFTGGTAISTANVTVRLGQATCVFTYVSASSGTVILRGYGIPGHLYDVQYSATADFPPTPGTFGPVTAAANGMLTYTDTTAGAGPRYYRLAVHAP